MLGLGLSVTQLAARGLRLTDLAAAIRSLFAAGEQGVWYDPSDLTTLFQDAAGTIPVTAVEQPVGLMRDKSGRNNHAYQTTSTNRPVLSGRYNRYVGTETLATQSVTTLAANYTLSFSGAGSITLSGTATGTYSAGTHTITCTAGTLTSTVSGTVTKADLRVANDGVGLPAYQRVNTATDYDTTGFPLYLSFNGSNQWMQTAAIDFTGTDKMTVFAGVRKLSEYPSGMMIAEFGQSAPNGSWYLYSFSDGVIYFQSRGTQAQHSSTNAAPKNTNFVAAGIADISGKIVNARVNSVSYNLNTGDQGTGNYGNYPLYIGARAGNTLWFNGRLYSMVVRGAQSTEQQITDAETYINSKTKAYA